MPWLPQTCARLPTRRAAVSTLLSEMPDVGWKLLLELFPNGHPWSTGSHRPTWEIIAEDWSNGVTRQDYWEQVALYAELAVGAAKQDLAKLIQLIDRFADLPPAAREQILGHLRSEAVTSMGEADRQRLWTELVDLVTKHKKFSDAEWAMTPEVVEEIAAVADRLAPDSPLYQYQRLFSECELDLYEEHHNFEEQSRQLDGRRQNAVREVFAFGRSESVLEFAQAVESPWRVGFVYGEISPKSEDTGILPALLESEDQTACPARERVRPWTVSHMDGNGLMR